MHTSIGTFQRFQHNFMQRLYSTSSYPKTTKRPKFQLYFFSRTWLLGDMMVRITMIVRYGDNIEEIKCGVDRVRCVLGCLKICVGECTVFVNIVWPSQRTCNVFHIFEWHFLIDQHQHSRNSFRWIHCRLTIIFHRYKNGRHFYGTLSLIQTRLPWCKPTSWQSISWFDWSNYEDSSFGAPSQNFRALTCISIHFYFHALECSYFVSPVVSLDLSNNIRSYKPTTRMICVIKP